MKHAAWGAKKDIRFRINAVKKSPYNVTMKLPKIQPATTLPATPGGRQKVRALKSRPAGTGKQEESGVPEKPQPVIPPPPKSEVLPTPVGFRKIRDTSRQSTTPSGSKSRSTRDPLLWRIGEDYGE
jgi:hypothetical protein